MIDWVDWSRGVEVDEDIRDRWAIGVVADLSKKKFDVVYVGSGDTLVIAVRHQDGTGMIWDCIIRRQAELPKGKRP